jgi:hypothetical protein
MKTDVSIEYAHIYTNNKINEEHQKSLEILGELQKNLKQKNQTSNLLVLVDDYSFPDPTFDYDEFSDWLDKDGFKPDLILRESQLIPACDQVLQLIKNQKLKQQNVDYIKAKKYPCSLFVAAWYLLRLGHITHPIFDTQYQATKLVNILPESFKPFEDKAVELIKSTEFSDSVNNIDYKFFEGRLLV